MLINLIIFLFDRSEILHKDLKFRNDPRIVPISGHFCWFSNEDVRRIVAR